MPGTRGQGPSCPGAWAGIALNSAGGMRPADYPGVSLGAMLLNSIAYFNYPGSDLSLSPGSAQRSSLFATHPGWGVSDPPPGSMASLSVNTDLSSDAGRQIPNPNFGEIPALKLSWPDPNLVDRGEFITGFHCDRADDDPQSAYPSGDPNCIHWRGSAPDIGYYEYGS